MNAVIDTDAPSSPLRVAPHSTHKFKLLLRREFWEHKGGFLWAPIVVGGIASVFLLVAALTGGMMVKKHAGDVHFDGSVSDIGGFGDGLLMGGIGIASVVLAFVLFFYLLGSLYDDRRDRSVLFWKSMPVSDQQMVLSKVAWAVLLAPLVSMAVGLASGLAFWVIAALGTMVSGVGGASAIFTQSHPFRFFAGLLSDLPVQMLWSLPAVGWLMLCSAWSRRVPFLWATAAPILACAMVSFTGVLPGVSIAHEKLWYVVAYRGLLSIVPYSWLPTIPDHAGDIENAAELSRLIHVGDSWQVFAHADIWIGALAGVAMIYAAIRLRRWRDDN
jgi:ABC-2 type transport system permease protein